jgi:hypothetical protein
MKRIPAFVMAVLFALVYGSALAAYQSTPFTTINIVADNGVTYLYPGGYTTLNTCLYNRLELRETGDYYGNVENGRRIYAMILAAQLSGKLISLGYNDTDGPGCRVSGVQVQW